MDKNTIWKLQLLCISVCSG